MSDYHNVTVTLKRATFNTDYDMSGTMDPYFIFKLGDQKKQSSVKQEGGQSLSYDEKFAFKVNPGDILYVYAYDQDTVSDEYIGSAEVNIGDYISIKSGSVSETLKKEYFDEGKVYLHIQVHD